MNTTEIILLAHHNLTYKLGRPEYAPDAFEMQIEINHILLD